MMFEEFPKIARLSRECVITEKIDGTNAQVCICAESLCPDVAAVLARFPIGDAEPLVLLAGSRSRYITPEADNHGFARWVNAHSQELFGLGPGRHFGEWWGSGIQRGYGLPKGEKRFSLFNVARWHQVGAEPYVSVSGDPRQPPKASSVAPACCHVVPVIYRGQFSTAAVDGALATLAEDGSYASTGFDHPEGVICYHVAANLYFKKTLERDDEPKGHLVERQHQRTA